MVIMKSRQTQKVIFLEGGVRMLHKLKLCLIVL